MQGEKVIYLQNAYTREHVEQDFSSGNDISFRLSLLR
jgi:hypothetical protein